MRSTRQAAQRPSAPLLACGLLAAALLALGAPATASTMGEKVDEALGAASSVATRTGAAIEHGAEAAASGVRRGVKAGTRGVKRGAQAAASGVERGASWVATGVEKGARAVEGGASAAAGKLGIGQSKPHEPAPVETVKPKPVKRGG